jgi:hypothetical protein
MSAWQPIETAPRDRVVLLYGPLVQATDLHPKGAIRVTGFWCEIDGWSLVSTTWTGPFIKPTHWAELPDAPTNTRQP